MNSLMLKLKFVDKAAKWLLPNYRQRLRIDLRTELYTGLGIELRTELQT